MKVNLWRCETMGLWRWTLTDDHRPICRMESGSQPELHDAMSDIERTIEYLMSNRLITND
jgi:hypothetical protein